jgi:hypothetical protein
MGVWRWKGVSEYREVKFWKPRKSHFSGLPWSF